MLEASPRWNRQRLSVLEAVDFDIDHTVFSYIPNTAEAAFYGLAEGLNKELDVWKQRVLYETIYWMQCTNFHLDLP